MAALTPITPLEGDVEMFSRGKIQPLFSIDTALANRRSQLSVVPEVDTPATFLDVPGRSDKPRPVSEVTEIFEEDDDQDDLSEFEEDSEESLSFESNEGRRSQTTISTFDEVPTPQSVRRVNFWYPDARRSVEGPRGPHLFRSSTSSDITFDYALQLSPLLPKKQELRIDTAVHIPQTDATPTTITEAPAGFSGAVDVDKWSTESPRAWNTQQVSLWMYNSGIDNTIVEKFEYHHINGTVLLDLEFADLKELGIEQFGKRHEVWNKICSLREGNGRLSPVPTPFEDTSRRGSQQSARLINRSQESLCEDSFTPITPGAGKRRRRKHRGGGNDPITPADSVSIVAIEQLIPKPHKCPKGENCSKYKKQQRLLRRLQREHGLPISPENGGHIFLAGDPGNAFNAPKIVENVHRPISEAEPSVVGPSVVASSDLLGPGDMPSIALQADLLRQLEERDAQENVKHFLSLQHVEPPQLLQPPMTPIDMPSQEQQLEMFPPLQVLGGSQTPLASLQSLPRLQIPRSVTAGPQVDSNSANPSMFENAYMDPFSAFSPCRSAVASPGGVYRFGTPASEMDIPVTAMPLGPVSRDTSQSVPPNMQYRDPVSRTSSRQDWRRPSFALPSLNENEVFSPTSHSDEGSRRTSKNTLVDVIEEVKAVSPDDYTKKMDPRYPGVNHAGWMKKRKAKLLRHEWNDAHFRLSGNQLAMHRNDIPQSAILESLNIDEYAVGCSAIASNKLAAKFKALKLAGKEKDLTKDAAFEFQLVPDQVRGKTHHFAVKTRDERIDWMRELMLAKALKAKREGYEVEVNGKEV